MAEVGVLEIQIHDNSEKAASGLDNLASALTRVQDALGSKLKIGTMATQIGKLVEKMQTAIPEESISRIERLANAVEKLGTVGKVSAPSLKGLKIDSVKEAAKDAGESDPFSAMASNVETINEAQEESVKKIVEEKAAAREAQEAMQGVAESTERAAEEAGNVSEAMAPARDAIQEAKEEARQMEEAFRGASVAAQRVQSSTGKMKKFNPATGQFEEFDQASKSASAAEIYQHSVQRRFQSDVADLRRDISLQGANSMTGINAASIDTMIGIGSSVKSAEESLGVFIEKASEAQKVSWELMDTLNKPVTLDLASAIDQTLGIGAPVKSAEESLNVFIERATDAQRASWELMDTLNRPIELNWANAIDKMQGIGEPFKSAEDSMNVFIERASEAQRVSWELIDTLNTPVNLNWTDAIEQLQGIGAPVKSAEESMSAFMQAMQGDSGTAANIRELNPELQELCEEAIRNGTAVSSLTGKLADLDGELKQKKKDTNEARSAFQQFKDSIQNMTAPISGFIGQLARVARYRMLRGIIKQISEGFKEGVENYYHYSAAINNGFSAAMDRAATSLQTFKNSIGAAVAPVIEALIPILQQVVTWVVAAINYVNQFLALLAGKTTWSQAIDATASAFDNTKKKAGGANKAIKETDNAVKDLLADFDELNIIQSQTGDNGGSGGGGGGGGTGKTATDYKKMFTEVSKFDNGIKKLVDNLKKNFGSIFGLVAEIGATILAWKVSSAFSGIISQAAGLLGSAIILDVVFRLSKTFTSTFLDTGEPGWLLLSGLTPLVGGFIARRLLTQIGLTGMAAYVIPISLALGATATISAVLEDADVSALDAKSIEALILGALEAGAATGIALNTAGVLTATGAAAAGAAAALLTFGVAIGLKATMDAARDGMITEETLTADAISALLIGGGLAVVGGIIGLSAGAVAGVAGVGALATFGVLVAVQALLEKDKEEPVIWGSETLTQEEIEEVVGKMFTVHPKVRMSLLKSRIDVSAQSKINLMAAVRDSLEKVDALKIGLDTTDSLEELKKAVFTNDDSLMNRFKEHAKGQKTLVSTTLKFAFIPDENGQNTAGESEKNINKGWDLLEGKMAELGGKLTTAMDAAYQESLNGTISDETKTTIAKLTGMMADISAAISYGKTAASSMSGFKAMAKGLTKATTDEVIAYYAQMKDELIAAEMEALKETADSALALSYAYQYLADHADNDADRQKYSDLAKNYSDEYTKLIDNAADSAKETVEKKLSNDKDVTGFVQGMLDNITDAGWNDLKFNAINSNDLWTSIIGPMISPDGTVQENAVKDMKGMLQVLLKRAFGDENAQTFIDAIDAGMMGWDKLISPEIVKSIAESMGLAKESEEVRNAFVEMIQGIFGEKGYTKETVLPEVYVEQPVVAETVVEQEEPEVSDEGGFDWSNYDFGAGLAGLDFGQFVMEFEGADTMMNWGTFLDTLTEGTEDEGVAALQERLNSILETAFMGTGMWDRIKAALESGELNYQDIFGSLDGAVQKAIEDALELKNSDELTEKWNAILDEIFGGKYTPEVEVDPEVTGKTSGSNFARAAQSAARAAASGYTGDNGVWVNSAKILEAQNGAAEKENVQAGVSAGTSTMQQTLQTGMANRQGDIQSGVQAGTGSLLTALNSILSVAQAINNKQFTVNIVPSTTLGEVNKQSGRRLGRVTGNMEAPA